MKFMLMLILLNKQIYKYRDDVYKLYLIIKPFLNWRFLVCYGIAWIYHVPIYLGCICSIHWIKYICDAIVVALYTVIQENFFITGPIALYLAKKIFPEYYEELKRLIKLAIGEGTQDGMQI